MALDLFPSETFYKSDDEIDTYHEQERVQRELEFSDCKIAGSQIRDSAIQSTEVYNGCVNDSNFGTSTLTQLTTHNCSIEYSEIRGRRLEKSTFVHTLLKACIDDGKVIKYRPSGLSLSVLPVEIRLTIFEYVIDGPHDLLGRRRFGDSVERSIPALVSALRVHKSNLYHESLQVCANNYYFRSSFPQGLKDSKVPTQSLRRLSIW